MKILVTGKNGLVGSAIAAEAGGHDFVFVGREYDLTKEGIVADLFDKVKPDWAIHAAAKVGGVGMNLAKPAELLHENLMMNANVIHHAWRTGVQKLLVFSSVCVFPDGIPVMREDLMHKGEPFEGNFAYAHAKRMVDVQIKAYRKQYGVKNYCSIIPGNIFGSNDNYNLQDGHVLPALIHKIYLAKKEGRPLVCWGDGSAKREFIYSRDLARMILKILELEDIPQSVLISGETQHSIREVVESLCRAADFHGGVEWDWTRPNGQTARRSDLGVLRSLLGDLEFTDLDEALRKSYGWFEANYETARK